MRIKYFFILFSVLFLAVLSNDLMAAKGGKGGGGNGFPPGTHFNLNIIAKWSQRDSGNFTCPSPDDYQFDYKYADGTSCDPDIDIENCIQTPSDRNVIFIPREGSDGQRIDVVSGGKGKNATNILDNNKLEVTDWCTEVFPESGQGTPAAFFLPDNKDKGYEVFARLVGKPRKNKDDTPVSMTLMPDIESVSTECVILVPLLDEFGEPVFDVNDEVILIPDPDGATEPCQLLHIGSFEVDGGGVEVLRSGSDSSEPVKGKGAKKAVEVTDLFTFTGHVCLRPEPDFYVDLGVDTGTFCEDSICTDVALCCTSDGNNDGLFDICGYRDAGDDIDPMNEPEADPTAGNVLTLGEAGLCLAYADVGETLALTEYYPVPCQGPFINEWSFNIADIVDYFLTVQNNGGYVLQMRFYPNP